MAVATRRKDFAKRYSRGNRVHSYTATIEIQNPRADSQEVAEKTLTSDNISVRDSVAYHTSAEEPPHELLSSSSSNLPHRWRRRRNPPDTFEGQQTQDTGLPLDASAQLSALAAKASPRSIRARALVYLSLSKPRLTTLIVLTTTASYSLYPVAISPFAAHLTLSPLTLLTLSTGTFLASSAANALNMLLEPLHDAKMSRTRTRPLVRGLISKRAALLFAVAAGTSGVALLYHGVNPTVAFLGALNIVLYVGVYTPLKRISVLNTWAGALVGGIPPLMGWAAAAGQAHAGSVLVSGVATWQDLLFAADGSSYGGWLLAALLFAWQFPHFWALAYPIRGEYAAAGYKMLVSSNVRMASRSALRYSIAMFPICAGLSVVGVTSWWFVPASGVVNAWMTREAWRFWHKEGHAGSARGLFWASVWHLPLILVLAMVAKKGVWERVIWGGLDAEEIKEFQEQVQEEVRKQQQQQQLESHGMKYRELASAGMNA